MALHRFEWVAQAIPPVSSPCEAEAFTAEGAEHAESENQDSLAILVSRHLCGLSECNERAREKAYDSRKDAENAKESVKMWKRIRTRSLS